MFKPFVFVSLCVLPLSLFSTTASAFDDFCTPKLETYLDGLQKTVDSKYMPSSKKEAAQSILDKVAASRNEKGDCVLVDELF